MEHAERCAATYWLQRRRRRDAALRHKTCAAGRRVCGNSPVLHAIRYQLQIGNHESKNIPSTDLLSPYFLTSYTKISSIFLPIVVFSVLLELERGDTLGKEEGGIIKAPWKCAFYLTIVGDFCDIFWNSYNCKGWVFFLLFFILDCSNIKLIKNKNIPTTDFFSHLFLICVRLKFLSYFSLSSSFVACWNGRNTWNGWMFLRTCSCMDFGYQRFVIFYLLFMSDICWYCGRFF